MNKSTQLWTLPADDPLLALKSLDDEKKAELAQVSRRALPQTAQAALANYPLVESSSICLGIVRKARVRFLQTPAIFANTSTCGPANSFVCDSYFGEKNRQFFRFRMPYTPRCFGPPVCAKDRTLQGASRCKHVQNQGLSCESS